MPIVYKNIFEKLKERGYTTYKIEKDGIIGPGTLTRLNRGESVSVKTIGIICKLCGCQPGDILEYKKDDE